MLKDWNIVESNGHTLVWTELDKVDSLIEIEKMEHELGTEALYCTTTNSVAFKTNVDLDVPQNINSSQLELVARYVNPDKKFTSVLSEQLLHS